VTRTQRPCSQARTLADAVQVAHWQSEALIGGKQPAAAAPGRASESASATLTRNLNVPATECDSCRCRPGDVTGRRDANSVALTDRD